mmetsp:Transcript_52389/g.162618  ORF Transcript_52389/g.162618 Transcript_52389/m.162618 type:complete len:673 (-) Transcript_52389:32-2050(-)
MPSSFSILLLLMGHLICSSIELLSLPRIPHVPPYEAHGSLAHNSSHLLPQLRGGAPKIKLGRQAMNKTYLPGSLPEWAEAIVMMKNLTPAERVILCRETFCKLRESVEKHPADKFIMHSDATSDSTDILDDFDDDDDDNGGGTFDNFIDPQTGELKRKKLSGSAKDRRAYIKMLKEKLGDKWDPKILEQIGERPLWWLPDEPVFVNVTNRIRVPPPILTGIRVPNFSDPNLLLREAAKNGEYMEVERQVKAGADVNHTDPQFSCFTPLHWAAWYGSPATCRKLIELGAYKFPLDRGELTPYLLAWDFGRWDVLKELENLGAEYPIVQTMTTRRPKNETRRLTVFNEIFNPAYPKSDFFKKYSLRHIKVFDTQKLPMNVTPVAPEHGVKIDEDVQMTDDDEYPCLAKHVLQQEGHTPGAHPEIGPDDWLEPSRLPAWKEEAQEAPREISPPRDLNGRLHLNCPFMDKDACKALGGRWDMDKKSWFVPSGTKSAAFKKWWPREALLASLKQQEEEARKNAPPPVIHLTEEEAEIMVRDRREKGVVEGDWPRASQEFLDYWGINSTYSFPSSNSEGQVEDFRPEWANSTLFSSFTPRMLNKKYWALEHDDVQWMLNGYDVEPTDDMEWLQKKKFTQMKRLKRDLYKLARNVTFEEFNPLSEEPEESHGKSAIQFD